jgi:hypothetical protein
VKKLNAAAAVGSSTALQNTSNATFNTEGAEK